MPLAGSFRSVRVKVRVFNVNVITKWLTQERCIPDMSIQFAGLRTDIFYGGVGARAGICLLRKVFFS